MTVRLSDHTPSAGPMEAVIHYAGEDAKGGMQLVDWATRVCVAYVLLGVMGRRGSAPRKEKGCPTAPLSLSRLISDLFIPT